MSVIRTAEAPKRRLSLDEIQRRPEWTELRPRQQMFIRSYLQSGQGFGTFDAELAVRMSYDATARPENARLLAYELLENRRIKKVLNLFFGTRRKRK